MSFAAGARALSTAAIRYFGGDRTVTLRRRASLVNQTTGDGVAALEADGVQALGASALALKLAGLRGRIVAGATLTVAGHAAPYVVQADAEATTAGKLAVSIAPALAAEVATGAAVTLAAGYADRTVYAFRGEQVAEDGADGRATDRRAYHLVGDELAAPAPGDVVVDGGEALVVVEVRPVSPGGTPARWTVTVGELAS
ncbi:MAG TPA: hypothetical protein PKM64_03395 [Thermoanaerobaculia bacterium]|nr:hypothetical protein [Thermoanaerobaculia bacterium]